ncbi:MAG: hypothetical protein JXO22_02530 [Phycisphaerae bacterium]|nr:hypothetical protein [Phycisphaerae bacterium]
MSASEFTIRVLLFAAATMTAAPSAALPCLSKDCKEPAAEHVVQPAHSCCAGHSDTIPQTSMPTGNEQHPHDGAPCNCPAECPAPCGSGKLPCPPIESTAVAIEMSPSGVLACPNGDIPADAPTEAIFHPPRI